MKNHILESPENIKRVLAVSIGGLGDTVLFSPVLKAIHLMYPKALIDFLVASKLSRDIYSSCSWVDNIIVINTNRSYFFMKALALLPYALKSRFAGGFDIGVFATGLNPNISYFMTFFAGISHVFRASAPSLSDTDLDCNTALARIFNNSITKKDAFVIFSGEAMERVKNILAGHNILLETDNIIAVYLSMELSRRPRWPLRYLIEVLKKLCEVIDAKIILVGSTIEGEEWGKEDKDHVIDVNMAGAISIEETAALFSQCNLVLGNDGGPIHIAGALNIPVVDIAPNVPFSYKPPGEKTVVLHSNRTCCNYPERPSDCVIAECLTDITVDDVFRECINLWQRK